MGDVVGRFSSTTLAGRELTVPDDLDRPTLLLFAYEQRQQADVDTWLAVLPEDADVGVLEVPVLARRWQLARRFIDGGMASNMDQRTREQTMCVYTDVDAFRREVIGTDTDQIAVLLVDEDGAVRWRTTGAATPDGVTALRRAIAEAT